MARVSNAACAALIALALCTADSSAQNRDPFVEHFEANKADLADTGRNDYFVLEPGYKLTFSGEDEGSPSTLVITVLRETETIDGVNTRVVEERETVAGAVTEVSRNYYAISKRTGDVYCFGEDVDNYENGKVAEHSGSWRAEGDNHFGLAMPAAPRLGQRYYEEIAPGIALDRAEIVALDDTLSTPAGDFATVLRVEETTPLHPEETEYKYYAPGIGLIKDGDMLLASMPTMPGEENNARPNDKTGQ